MLERRSSDSDSEKQQPATTDLADAIRSAQHAIDILKSTDLADDIKDARLALGVSTLTLSQYKEFLNPDDYSTFLSFLPHLLHQQSKVENTFSKHSSNWNHCENITFAIEIACAYAEEKMINDSEEYYYNLVTCYVSVTLCENVKWLDRAIEICLNILSENDRTYRLLAECFFHKGAHLKDTEITLAAQAFTQAAHYLAMITHVTHKDSILMSHIGHSLKHIHDELASFRKSISVVEQVMPLLQATSPQPSVEDQLKEAQAKIKELEQHLRTKDEVLASLNKEKYRRQWKELERRYNVINEVNAHRHRGDSRKRDGEEAAPAAHRQKR